MAYDRKAPRPTNDSPIARRRIALGLTQGQLAEAIGNRQVDISRWERGIGNPGSKYLPRLAKALNCSMEDLIEA